ncbi:hypothetical protein LA080_014021 [Diaporthe eres]|uniref:Myb-like domain-containing protein n=1 Tax=Diaporthe vaccinii TaxID=105482 RepID=A0ABR4EXF3_9PEZI|nr:hypothetical protein LA080_014021 [Diaporthe eres]
MRPRSLLTCRDAWDRVDDDVQALTRQEIHKLYPLRALAQDTSVADMEIACDAAVTVAEAYNKAVPDINLRWFYTCVQSLLLPDLLPAVLLDGKVDRLSRNVQQPLPNISRSKSESKSSPLASSSTLGPDTAHSCPQQSTLSSSDTKLVPTKAAKAKWEHDEIQRMVELKASGLRHRDVATRLGRGQGSVENKYGRVMHNDEWKVYSTSLEASLRPKEKNTDKGSESPSP